MDAVFVATGRSPIGRAFKGSLADVRPDDLAAVVLEGVMSKVPGLQPGMIEDVVMGCVFAVGEAGFNIGRVAAVLAGLYEVPATTVNRACASSLQAIRVAAHSIMLGEGDVFIAAGVESVSRTNDAMGNRNSLINVRFSDAVARTAERLKGGGPAWSPGPGLPDIYIAMGQTAENVAEHEGISRQEMDEYAVLSQTRAVESQESGFFAEEIVPITLPNGTVIRSDDGPRRDTTVEALSQLRPAFREGGSVTAGNSCPLNDGAAAVILMSAEKARSLGVKPIARVVSSAVTALNPEIMGLGPVEACRLAMHRAKMTAKDIDLVEINEAFAAQVIPSARHLEISWDKLNVRGGAIALGHPFGMTGARIMTTLLHALEDEDKTIGMESMCVGGGQGMAMIVERL